MNVQWILFEAYDDYFTANLMMSKLRDEGFVCKLTDENIVTIDPILSNSIGGIKLMVLKKDADRIKDWYVDYQANQALKQICPFCKKQGVIKNPDKNKSTSILAFFQAIFKDKEPNYRKFKCQNCGHKFDETIFIDEQFNYLDIQ